MQGFWTPQSPFAASTSVEEVRTAFSDGAIAQVAQGVNGRPQLSPLPDAEEVWQCEVVVIGGSLGGVAAAAQAMQSGAITCLIELTPWLGGQISSQGVSAIDESLTMRWMQNFSPTWKSFKQLIEQQPTFLPAWSSLPSTVPVASINRCWVGTLCFPPKAGAIASLRWLEAALPQAPESRWSASTAFKGAEFDASGREITAIYAVRRIPRQPGYVPYGRLSGELSVWYSWTDDDQFDKIPIRLEPLPGSRMIVIDATDTSELIAWADIPYLVGSDSRTDTKEPNAALQGNPECTQAFTYPFVLAIREDGGESLKFLSQVQPDYGRHEHTSMFSLENFPMFHRGSLFNYRRIVSTTQSDPMYGSPAWGDMTAVNWNRGNDWTLMNPTLLLSRESLTETGQYQNWMGGISWSALRHAENHALLFSEWLIRTQATSFYPLSHLRGVDSPMGTQSGLSMVPYIRESRRILGRNAYGQEAFMIAEMDIRKDMQGGRDLRPTAIAVTHYTVDMHGCRYRNWEPTGEAQGAGTRESLVHPIWLPLEALIPQGVDNLLIGGKGIAVTHIVNGATRVHYGEWSIGSAAGGTAGWLIRQNNPNLSPADIIPQGQLSSLRQHLQNQGLRTDW